LYFHSVTWIENGLISDS